ncbi:hypothetical protein HK097_010142 [Rhizophlyctis rosea]|uniref:RIIa domain-containing protein n=1 Tax=Rhizophlyctis rosea TaxID=64517 RepID=A0AAD5X2R7_9FUNG|nr:hypothetical protein HK097_010142 [Rhizophlyctis rosea]
MVKNRNKGRPSSSGPHPFTTDRRLQAPQSYPSTPSPLVTVSPTYSSPPHTATPALASTTDTPAASKTLPVFIGGPQVNAVTVTNAEKASPLSHADTGKRDKQHTRDSSMGLRKSGRVYDNLTIAPFLSSIKLPKRKTYRNPPPQLGNRILLPVELYIPIIRHCHPRAASRLHRACRSIHSATARSLACAIAAWLHKRWSKTVFPKIYDQIIPNYKRTYLLPYPRDVMRYMHRMGANSVFIFVHAGYLDDVELLSLLDLGLVNRELRIWLFRYACTTNKFAIISFIQKRSRIQRPANLDARGVWYLGVCDAVRAGNFALVEFMLEGIVVEKPEWELMRTVGMFAGECEVGEGVAWVDAFSFGAAYQTGSPTAENNPTQQKIVAITITAHINPDEFKGCAALPETLKDLNREIVRNQPEDIYQFCADHSQRKLSERERKLSNLPTEKAGSSEVVGMITDAEPDTSAWHDEHHAADDTDDQSFHDDEEDDEVEEDFAPPPPPSSYNRSRLSSVSAESKMRTVTATNAGKRECGDAGNRNKQHPRDSSRLSVVITPAQVPKPWTNDPARGFLSKALNLEWECEEGVDVEKDRSESF